MNFLRMYRARKRLLLRELRLVRRSVLSFWASSFWNRRRKISEDVVAAANRNREQITRSQALTRDALYEHALNLAEQHQARIIGRGSRILYKRFADHCRMLEETHDSLEQATRNNEVLTPGAEWLLDNYHLVLQQITDIKNHFPRGYDRSLPKITSGKFSGYPRVYHIALELLIQSDSVVNLDLLTSYIRGYQAHSTLTMGEVWAVPIMLRFALIENLGTIVERMASAKEERKVASALIDEIIGDETRSATQVLNSLTSSLTMRPEILFRGSSYIITRLREMGRRAYLALQWLEERLREEGLDPEEMHRDEQYLLAADQVSIGNTVNSLRSVNLIDWKVWFESVSVVEQVLGRDPVKLYPHSDFQTRDRCRHIIERLSKRTNRSESDIAQAVVELAKEHYEELSKDSSIDPLLLQKRAHIGYYLIGQGRLELEKKLCYQADAYLHCGRFFKQHAFLFYGLSISLLTLLFIYHAVQFSIFHGTSYILTILIGLLFIVPASDLAINIVQWFVTRLVPPDFLPKLDYSKGIPTHCKTAVTVQSLLTDIDSVNRTIEALEVQFLGNNDQNLVFGILADFPDADQEETAKDELLFKHANELINELKQRHSTERFFILFRKRQWNPSQRKFMGWERKRGKIEEFNRLILGEGKTSFIAANSLSEILRDIKYVITLDNDSQLPRDSARRLVGTINHPLNAAILNKKATSLAEPPVLEGYSIVQPRVGITLVSANSSLFAKIFTGHAGLDPYTQTVSEVYQDLFHEGSFIGKGIYHVAAFHHALKGRVPDNAVLSHDLFEGLFARVILATDIELFDDFPSKYHVHARRQHRWVRGDWQLLPWILPRIPNAEGKSYRSPLSNLSRWKLIDNLRRSLLAPSLIGLFICATTAFSGPSFSFLVFLIIIIAFPVYANLAQAFLIPRRNFSMKGHVRSVWRDLVHMSKQTLFTICFLPHQAILMLDAITTTLYRLCISRRNFLDWETAYHAEKRLSKATASVFYEMRAGVIIATIMFVLVISAGSESLIVSIPFFLLWLTAPFIAKHISNPIPTIKFEITNDERVYLNDLAFDSWKFFRELMNEENNYLVPDNIQLVPQRQVVDRTSVTNISLSILSAISASDLGYMCLNRNASLLENTFQSLTKLDRLHGHFLNWYNIHTLTPLNPRYISMVDSGNMLGHLIAAKVAFNTMPQGVLFTDKHFLHLKKLLNHILHFSADLEPSFAIAINKAISTCADGNRSLNSLSLILNQTIEVIKIGGELPSRKAELNSYLTYLDDLVGVRNLIPSYLLIEKVESDLAAKGSLSSEISQLFTAIKSDFEGDNLSFLTLRLLYGKIDHLLTSLKSEHFSSAVITSLIDANSSAKQEMAKFDAQMQYLAESSSRLISEMDFRFLYDAERDLFPIGYDVDNARRDQSFYDLFASEARLGSFAAIATGQVPQQHWFALGRPLTDALGGKTLLSWSGTMFEYLMPLLVMKSFEGTLLAESYKAAIRTQILYAKRRGVPWGISESGYSGVDFEKTYQYYAFGVPSLGLKRGLEDDLVISPYSTVMALPIAYKEAMLNLKALEEQGARGKSGFYEAIDYTPSRLSKSETSHLVKSYLAHHQGMILVTLNNLLNYNVMQERFHSDQQVKATELLLHERFPDRTSIALPHSDQMYSQARESQEESVELSQTLTTPFTALPVTHLISSAHYAVMVDNTGSGFSLFDREVMLTRWREDSIKNDYGMYFFIRDLDSGKLWSATYQPTCVNPEFYEVVYSPDKIEFKRKDSEIFTHCEITVSPEDDVEIRKLSFTNLSATRRHLEITSFAEVALNFARADIAHPAFSKMFIESEFISDLDCLLLSRRPRSPHEATMHLFHMVTMRTVWQKLQYDTSRVDFIGRGRSIHDPVALDSNKKLSGKVGSILDPIFSVRTVVELEPGNAETVNFITGAARDKEALLAVASRYKQVHQISRAFEMAWSQSSVELRNEKIAARQSQVFQRLANILLYNVQKFRAKPELIVHNRMAQSALWRLGISGDTPIVLIRITEPEQSKVVQELLAAHHYLRIRGLIFDLVILNEYPGGYMQNLQEELEFMIRSSFSGYLMDKNGGVFLRTDQQVSQQELELLQVVARAVLSGSKGTLGSQLKFDELFYKDVPRSRNNLITSNSKELLKRAAQCEFFNGYGGFIGDGKAYRTYVNGDTFPPLPWSNVIANPDFGTLITESGGGYSWTENSREFRLTTWSNDPVSDPASEAIYLKNQDNGRYWCPTPRPVKSGAVFQVEHKFGSSTFETEIENIKSKLTISVAPQSKLKWFKLELKNESHLPKTIEAYFFAEWVLGVQREDTSRFLISAFDSKNNILHAQNFYNMDFPGRVIFLGCSEDIITYTASRREFLGRNRTMAEPAGLDRQVLDKKVGAGFDSCGVIKSLISIRPNEEKTIYFYLGAAESLEVARDLVKREAKPEYFVKHQKLMIEEIDSLTNAIQVRTPDRSMDILMNGWLLYQGIICRIFARTGFYQSGGAFGFRDQLQDTLAVLLIKPELARKQILLHASRQFPEGDVQHWWHPPTGKGIRTRITDNYLWLPYVTARYIEATGDFTILEESVGFIMGPQLAENEMEIYMVPQPWNENKSLYEHCILALERSFRFGVHGIPLMGGGDWNDGMNEVGKDGKGESVWLGWFLIEVLKRFVPFIDRQGETERKLSYEAQIERLTTSIESNAWDGEWYRRAYFDDGTPLGSKNNSECKIDSLSQSWAVISRSGDKARTVEAMESVYRELVDEEHDVIKLLKPPFNDSSLYPGYIKGYLPGIRENGGQYTHGASWTIIASAMMGRGDKAHSLFQIINPINHTKNEKAVDIYKGEPYVLCGDVYAAPPHEGRAGWSWYSGSAGWIYQAGLHFILGINVKYDHIHFNPCIPESWREYQVDAKLRGTRFLIKVENPKGVQTGIKEILLNGEKIAGDTIPFSKVSGQQEVSVRVIMG